MLAERRGLVLVDLDLERHVVGELGEGLEVVHDRRAPLGEGPRHDGGGLPGARVAEAHHHVAGAKVAVELREPDEPGNPHPSLEAVLGD